MASKKQRLDRLEAKVNSGDKPIVVVHQSLDDPELYYLIDHPEKLMTKQETLDSLQDDCTLIWITYRKDWRDREVRSDW